MPKVIEQKLQYKGSKGIEKHWPIFQYIDSETLRSIQYQCWKIKCQFFNVKMLVSNVLCQFADP